jgi:phosphatidylglycerophosphatase A
VGDAGHESPKGSVVARWLATWFGCGYVPYAPGTAGTLGAIPLYLALRPCGHAAVALAALVLTCVGVWAANVFASELREKDPQVIVIDEVAGVLVTLSVAPPTWAGLAAGVVLFRIFDQTKPWPARTAEQKLPGGWGIVLDDVAAGV